jgi:hypothetical protein
VLLGTPLGNTLGTKGTIGNLKGTKKNDIIDWLDIIDWSRWVVIINLLLLCSPSFSFMGEVEKKEKEKNFYTWM